MRVVCGCEGERAAFAVLLGEGSGGVAGAGWLAGVCLGDLHTDIIVAGAGRCRGGGASFRGGAENSGVWCGAWRWRVFGSKFWDGR